MEEKLDILEIAKELNAVVVLDDDAKEKCNSQTIEEIKAHNEMIKNSRTIDENDEEDEYDFDDVEAKQDVNKWPGNLIDEIFGFKYSYNPEYEEQISDYFRNNQKVKEVTDTILGSILVKEAKIIRSIYMEGKSIQEIAKQKKKTTEEILELKHSALRKLRNPKRAKGYRQFFTEIDNTIIDK